MKTEQIPEAAQASGLESSKKSRRASLKAAPQKPKPAKTWAEREAEKTQGGLAEKLAQERGEDFKHCDGLGWLAWTGTHWKEDEKRVGKAIDEMAKSLFQEASDLLKEAGRATAATAGEGGEKPREAKDKEREARDLLALGRLHRTAKGVWGVKAMAQMHLNDDTSSFDRNIWLLNCANGTLNLTTGELYPHRREDRITKLIHVEYHKDAPCPTWERFMSDIMLQDLEMVQYLQRIIGLCLSGDTREHHFFILYGQGKNGKSTFMTTIQKLMGDYARSIHEELLLQGRPANPHGPTEEIAKLAGARMAIANETEPGRKLAEAMIKQMTGGDIMTARRLHKAPFEFVPQFKLFLRTNHRPEVGGTDDGIWRRLKQIPFDAQFPPGSADLSLPHKLLQELPGILAWSVRGLHDYLENGLPTPEKVLQATQDYREDQDKFSAWLKAEFLVKVDPDRGVTSNEVLEEYAPWATLTGARKLSDKAIGKALAEQGWAPNRGPKGEKFKIPPAHLRPLCKRQKVWSGSKTSKEAAYDSMSWIHD